jgi:hypothetical protein
LLCLKDVARWGKVPTTIQKAGTQRFTEDTWRNTEEKLSFLCASAVNGFEGVPSGGKSGYVILD